MPVEPNTSQFPMYPLDAPSALAIADTTQGPTTVAARTRLCRLEVNCRVRAIMRVRLLGNNAFLSQSVK
jgi:hypothetical protein